MNNLEWVELGCGLAYGSEPEYALFCTFRFYTVCDGMNLKYWNWNKLYVMHPADYSDMCVPYSDIENEKHNKFICEVFYLIFQILFQCLR